MSEDTDNTPQIEVRDNAFVKVSNVKSITGTDGALLEEKPVTALCRCGHSQNKPFCDGSHRRVEFDGSAGDTTARNKIYTYEGTDITVYYSKLLCSHAAECESRLHVAFNPDQRPWIQPDNADADAIKAVVRACPSGALRYSLKGEEPQHLDGDAVAIKVDKNGPYRVSNIDLANGVWTDGASHKSYVLCRCGLSGNKPFCDGSHRDANWSDEG